MKKKLSGPIDLTVGKPWRVILRYAAPIMFSYFLQQIYVLTDAIICGQVLTAGQVAGVNDTFPLTFIFLQFAFGCTAGFSVLTGSCVGSGDKKGTRRSFVVQIYLSLAISAVLTVAALLLLPTMLSWIHLTPDHREVYDAAYTYCFVIFLGIIAQMGYNFVCGVLRALGDSVSPLLFLVFSTLLNVGLDILFLVPFDWGPMGAAVATILAQMISVVVSFVYTLCRYPDLRLHREDFCVGWRSVLAHLRQGVPLGLQFSILAVGIIVMQGAMVQFDLTADGSMVAGTPAQNGFGAANKLINFLMAFFNGLGSAILGFNAQNYGAGEYRRIRKGTVQTLLLMLGISVACSLTGFLLSINGSYQYIFLSADKVSEATVRFGNTFLYVDIALYAILGFLIVTRSAVQGICRSGYVLGAGIAELFARILICSFLPAAINGAPIDASASTLAFAAMCFGDPGAWIAASVLLLIPLTRNIIRMHYPELADRGDFAGKALDKQEQ
ncbi:mATE efflux family protein DinF [Clostridium sp. CAG:448]|nr:mATE efflux family protein DinF [Clostridium sp. CAG:448]